MRSSQRGKDTLVSVLCHHVQNCPSLTLNLENHLQNYWTTVFANSPIARAELVKGKGVHQEFKEKSFYTIPEKNEVLEFWLQVHKVTNMCKLHDELQRDGHHTDGFGGLLVNKREFTFNELKSRFDKVLESDFGKTIDLYMSEYITFKTAKLWTAECILCTGEEDMESNNKVIHAA